MSERLFLAIGFDEDLCLKLNQAIKKVKINLDKREVDYKWVLPENYHVTLVFFGEKSAEERKKIVEVVHSLEGQLQPFDLQISGVDAFSSERQARLVYCGVQNKKDLRGMVDLIRTALGLESDESYVPHLTVARLRNQTNVKDIISPVRRKDFFKISVTEIRLYRSHLQGHYPVYQLLERFSLKNSKEPAGAS